MTSSEIDDRAQAILAEYADRCGMDSVPIPVDVLAIASELGLTVMEAKFKNPALSGAITPKDDAFTVYLNREQAMTRRRFTLAHEIGHFILHLDQGKSTGTYTDDSRSLSLFRGQGLGVREQEIDANRFAAALLMPTSEVVQRLERFVGDVDTYALAQEFWVSQLAMEIRLQTVRGIGIFA